MNPKLKWFYLAVQFVMLLVSVPKVASLFGAYDAQTTGLTFMGLDIRDWLVGVAIDATVAITSWAAMTRYEATRQRRDLTPSVIIVLYCVIISVIANYEDAAAMSPARYAHLTLIHWSAVGVNALLVASPPFIVVMLQCLVPSILAQPRLKTAAQIAAETEEKLALMRAEAQLKQAQAEANAVVRSAQLAGLVRTGQAFKSAVRGQVDTQPDSDSLHTTDRTPDDDPDGPGSGPGRGGNSGRERSGSADLGAARVRSLAALPTYTDRSVLSHLSAAQRVRRTQSVRTGDLAEVLGVSESQALAILRGVPEVERDGTHSHAALVAPLTAVKAYLRVRYPAHYATLKTAVSAGGRAPRAAQSGSGSVRSLDRGLDRSGDRSPAVVASAARTAPIALLRARPGAQSDEGYAEA